MKIRLLTGALIALSFAVMPARAADDAGLARLATCQDSWLVWQKTDTAKLKSFGEHFRADFSHKNSDAFSTPKTDTSMLGLHVAQVFPESVGMGVGFFVTVDAPFDRTRRVMEKALGKKVGKCDTGDGMHMCELDIAEEHTFTIMSGDDPKTKQTLVGCYYLYEK